MVLGSATSEGARAYYRGGRSFTPAPNDGGRPGFPSMVADADGGTWQVTEGFLVNTADESEKLARIPTHMSFWFGWFQFHPDTELVHGALAGGSLEGGGCRSRRCVGAQASASC